MCVCDRVSVLVNPLPIGHDMFISLLPVCIVNATPQPQLQCTRVFCCMCQCVFMCMCELLISTSTERRRRSQIHRDNAEISAGIKRCLKDEEEKWKLLLNSLNIR